MDKKQIEEALEYAKKEKVKCEKYLSYLGTGDEAKDTRDMFKDIVEHQETIIQALEEKAQRFLEDGMDIQCFEHTLDTLTMLLNEVMGEAYTAGYNKAIGDASKYLDSYSRSMDEPMCEYTHTQTEAQKYILKRVSKALRELKKDNV